MSLLALVKKKKKENSPCACCNNQTENKVPGNCEGKVIKVFGSGCKNCHTLYENTCQAVKNLGIHTEVEYVTDMQQIMLYGVMRMPALVIDEQVVSMGRVLQTGEVEKLLQNHA
ncbi:MAG TPA: TM0996/MTH895 family glutaredoxin-like protein [Candidatus Gallacutalibacter pullistercoris]|nr:TM0996/MTH895 family glutaredoxin-like protein [Candidatus Gallacutalibacter pullistercoris]